MVKKRTKKCGFCKKNIDFDYNEHTTNIIKQNGDFAAISFCSEACLNNFEYRQKNEAILLELLGYKRLPKDISDLVKEKDPIKFNDFLNNRISDLKKEFNKELYGHKKTKAKASESVRRFIVNSYIEINDTSEIYTKDYSKIKKKKPRKTIFDIEF